MKIFTISLLLAFNLGLNAFAAETTANTTINTTADITTAENEPTANIQATMIVYKSPQCGCCGEWVSHMEEAGFNAETNHPQDLNTLKASLGIPPRLQSCHTAVSGDYVFEGHIPATIIQRFLSAPPPGAIGLAVPGMPLGSPGMEMGDRRDPYDVLLLLNDGSTSVYEHISGQ